MENPEISSKAAAWRQLRFESIDECVAEVERILQADREQRLQATGNWTAGQVLTHLAAWIEYGYSGYPLKPPPFFIRWVLRLGLRKMLEKGMSRGVRIPGVKAGTYGADDDSVQDGGRRYLSALERLASGEEGKFHSPAFGPMSHADRIRLNLRHAELHLGYLKY